VLGVAFLRRHRRTWEDRKNDPAVPLDERGYYHRQYRRRMLTSGLLVLLGILIPCGDLLLDRRFPMATAILYWVGVLVLVLFVLLLGFVDFFATGLHTKDALLRIRGEKAALERQVEEVRRALREGRGQEAGTDVSESEVRRPLREGRAPETSEPPRLGGDRFGDRLRNGLNHGAEDRPR
jgi:hypothetical protein